MKALLLAALVAASSPIYAAPRAHGTLTWTERDVQVTTPGGVAWSARRDLEHAWGFDQPKFEAWGSWHVRSVVGDVVTIEQMVESAFQGCAHPGGGRDLRTLDLGNEARPVPVTRFWDEAVMVRAIAATPKAAMLLSGLPLPSAVDALAGRLACADSPCEWGFPRDMATRWGFHHLAGDRVVVRFGLSHGCEAARGALTALDVALPIPPALAKPLADAAARRGGFLMADAAAIAGGRHTAITLPARR